MDKNEMVEVINEVFEETFEIEKGELLPDKNIFMDLGLDSLDMVDLIVALQKKFKVQIRENEGIRDIRTLDNLYDFVISLKENREYTRAATDN